MKKLLFLYEFHSKPYYVIVDSKNILFKYIINFIHINTHKIMKNLYISFSHRDLDFVLGRYCDITEKSIEEVKSKISANRDELYTYITSQESGIHFNYIAIYGDNRSKEIAIARLEDERGNVLDTREISLSENKTIEFANLVHTEYARYDFPDRILARFFMAKKVELKYIVPDDFDFDQILFHYRHMFRFGNGEEFHKEYMNGNIFVGKTNIDPMIIGYKGLPIGAVDGKVEAYGEGMNLEYYFILDRNNEIKDADVYNVLHIAEYGDKDVTLESQVRSLYDNE